MTTLILNRFGSLVGGAEHFLLKMAEVLREQNEVHLALPARENAASNILGRFDSISNVECAEDMEALVRNLSATRVVINTWNSAKLPAFAEDVLFHVLHDASPFCPRTHKYTLLRRQPCDRVCGIACLRCALGTGRDAQGELRLGSLKRHRQNWSRLTRGTCLYGSQWMRNQAELHGLRKLAPFLPGYVEPRSEEWVNAHARNRVRDRKLLFVGSLLPGKGPDHALRLFAQTMGTTLDFVGRGPMQSQLQHDAEKLGVSHRVRFHGWQPPQRVNELMEESSLLLFTSRAPESFGLSGIEAAATGLPVAGFTVGGSGEWMAEGKTALSVPYGEQRQLTARICDVLQNEDRWRRMSLESVKAAGKNFTRANFKRLLRDSLGLEPVALSQR